MDIGWLDDIGAILGHPFNNDDSNRGKLFITLLFIII
jgi:hypothetical protein